LLAAAACSRCGCRCSGRCRCGCRCSGRCRCGYRHFDNLDLGLGFEILEILFQVLLLQMLGQVGFDFVKGWRFYRPGIFQQNDVIAVLGLDRFLRECALFQLADGAAELRHHTAHVEPAQITAPQLGAGISGFFHGQLRERCRIVLQLGNNRIRLGFALDEDVARLVFAASNGGLDTLVLGFQHVVTDWIVLDEILYIGVGQNRLPEDVELLGDFGQFVQAFFHRCLSDQGLHGQLVDDALSGFRSVRFAGAGTVRDNHVDTALVDGGAVHGRHGHSLHRWCRCRRRCRLCILLGVAGAEDQQRSGAGQQNSGFDGFH
jgi:hypothetical protein